MSGAGAVGEADPRRGRPAAVVLAAGQSRRMGARNKLLLDVEGVPMIRKAVGATLAAGLDPVVVVLGHETERVRGALVGLGVVVAENERPQDGLSGSLRAGIEALPPDCAAAFVLLGDMPWIEPRHLHALSAALDPAKGREICVPVHGGRRGNPVLWSRRFFPEMRSLEGDVGANGLMVRHEDAVHEVLVDDDAVLRDVDTLESWAAAAGAQRRWRP